MNQEILSPPKKPVQSLPPEETKRACRGGKKYGEAALAEGVVNGGIPPQ